jgi:histidine ammonia-lyase
VVEDRPLEAELRALTARLAACEAIGGSFDGIRHEEVA